MKSITRVGGEFVGFSSDAPATMVGAQGGVGALRMDKAGFVRHDIVKFMRLRACWRSLMLYGLHR